MDNGIPTHDGEPRYQITTHLGSRVANLKPSWNDPNQVSVLYTNVNVNDALVASASL